MWEEIVSVQKYVNKEMLERKALCQRQDEAEGLWEAAVLTTNPCKYMTISGTPEQYEKVIASNINKYEWMYL